MILGKTGKFDKYLVWAEDPMQGLEVRVWSAPNFHIVLQSDNKRPHCGWCENDTDRSKYTT